jgi:leucyl aminopeptidase
MNIAFVDAHTDSIDTLVFAIAKDALGPLPVVDSQVLIAGAAASRFSGECGGIYESFAIDDGKPLKIVLVGVGNAEEADMERAGAALAARILCSGSKVAAVSLAQIEGISGVKAARFAYGARLRSWRMDRYRTKMPEKAKPTLETVQMLGAPAGAQEEWIRLSAIADGVVFTRELVAEPANILYPETFVERCREIEALGVKLRVLDEEEMARLGMVARHGMGWDGRNSATPAGSGGQRRNIRYWWHIHQTGSRHGRHEMGHGRRRRRCGHHEGARDTPSKGSCGGHMRAG